MNRELRKRVVGTTGALMLVCALSAITSIAALSFVGHEGERLREASDHLLLVNSLRQRLLGLFTAGERAVVVQDGFDRFSEMQAAVAKARERLRTQTAGTYVTPDIAVLDRDADDLRIAIQRLQRAQPIDPRQALVSYREALRSAKDAFEADVDSVVQKLIAHERDSFEHSSSVVRRARWALAFIAMLAICTSISFGVMTVRELQRAGHVWTPTEIADRVMRTSSRLILAPTASRPEKPQLLGRIPGKDSGEG